jgi:hypothetical protein
VSAPTIGKTIIAYSLKSNTCLNLSIRYIPADTSVALWISADAGTGASIESGNQICQKNCADFIDIGITKKNAKISMHLVLL